MIPEPDEWRAARLSTFVELLFMVITVVGISLFTDSLVSAKYPVEEYNRLVGWAFVGGGVVTIVGTIVVPWASLHRSKRKWSTQVLRAAPFLGLASLLGSLVGFVVCGVGANVLFERLWGPIEHNSLLDIPMVALSLIGLVTGSLIAGAMAVRVSKRGVA